MIILLKDPKYIRREKWGNSFSISFNNYFNCLRKVKSRKEPST